MTLIEFLNDIYLRVCSAGLDRDDFFITVGRDPSDDNLFVYFPGRWSAAGSYGKYKTNTDFTSGINITFPFVLFFSPSLVDSLNQLNDEADKPHIKSHVKFIDDYVPSFGQFGKKYDNEKKQFGISVETLNEDSGVSSRTFHRLPPTNFGLVKDVQERILPKFSSVDFSVNFSSVEVKDIVNHLYNDSVLDYLPTMFSCRGYSNVIYFRRNSSGKLFLEARDLKHSYSVHTDHDIDEDKLYIPIRIRIREFLIFLNTCSENNRGVTIVGKVFSDDFESSSSSRCFLKVIDEDDFARYEYLIPYYDEGLRYGYSC